MVKVSKTPMNTIFTRTTSDAGKNFGPFGGATFMGLNFRPDEVISAIQKELRRNNAEEAYMWIINMMASGSIERVWGRLLVIASEDISIGNPYLSAELWTLYARYREIRKELEKSFKQGIIEERPVFFLRNIPEIRELLCKATMLVSNSFKTRITDHIPKIYFKSRDRNDWHTWADMPEYPIYTEHIVNKDPMILINRLTELLIKGIDAMKEDRNTIDLEKEAFDIAGYLFQLGTKNKKTKYKFLCKNNKNKEVSCTDIIWGNILSIILSHPNKYFKNEIQSLYNIFKVREDSMDDKKLPFIHAILLFFRYIDWNKAVADINREIDDGTLSKLCNKLNEIVTKRVLYHVMTGVPPYAIDKHTKRGKRGKDDLTLTKQFLYDELEGLNPKLKFNDIYQDKAFELEIKRKNLEASIPSGLHIPSGLEDTVIQLLKVGKKDKSHLIRCIQEAGLLKKELYGVPIKFITEEKRNDIQKLPHAQLKAGKHKRVVYVGDEVVIKGPYKIRDKSFIHNLMYTGSAELVEKTLFNEDKHHSILPWNLILNYGGEYYLVAKNIGKSINEEDIEIKSSTIEKDQKIIKRGAFINRIQDIDAHKLNKEQIKAILKHLYIRYILGIGDSGLHNILKREDTKTTGRLIVGNDLEERRGSISNMNDCLKLLFRGSGPKKEYKILFNHYMSILKGKNNEFNIMRIADKLDDYGINFNDVVDKIKLFEKCK